MLDSLQRIDEAILLWIHQGWSTPWADRFFVWITDADHFVIPLGIVWLALLIFGGRQGRILALMLAITLLLTDQISSHLIKPWVGRVRPCFAVEGVNAFFPQARSASFPSSHATNIFGAAVVFALSERPRWIWVPAYVVALLVSLSRVYVGVHYPLDVMAGALLGLGLGTVVFLVTTRWLPLNRFGGKRSPGGAGRGGGPQRCASRSGWSGRMGILRCMALMLAAALCGCGGEPADSVTSGEQSLPPEQVPLSVTVVDTVRRGDTMSSLLLRSRLYLRDIEAVLREVRAKKLFSLRRLKPGEVVAVELDFDGRLREVRYERSPDEVYVVSRSADAMHSYRTGLAYTSHLRKISGTLETTVDELLRAGGAGPEVTYELTSIFDSDIDFLTEPRVGDRLTVLLEEKRYEGERVTTGDIYYASYEGQRVSQTGIRFEIEDVAEASSRYFTPEGNSLVRAFLRSPLNYRRISSTFSHNRLHPILRVYRPHLGVDYAAAPGTPVVALGDGVVSFAGWNGGFGRQVRIRHGSIYETCYGHLSRFGDAVRSGARVRKGQVIGYVGSSGLSTGPHLDFRVRRYGAYINPLKMENPSTAPVPDHARGRFRQICGAMQAVADTLSPERTVRLERVLGGASSTAQGIGSGGRKRDS